MPKKAVGNQFEERVQALLAGESLRGTLHEVDPSETKRAPQLLYEHSQGELWCGSSLPWLQGLEADSVDLVFADPPYNLGKADWDRFESHDSYCEWMVEWIAACQRVLRSSGSLYVCGFSEVLADIRRPAAKLFDGCRWLVWSYKNKANLSRSWGRSHESILYLTKGKRPTFNVDDVRVPYGRHTLKYPEHPQSESSQYSREGKDPPKGWRPHPRGAKPRDVFELPTTSNGMTEKTPHPTQKPEELLRKLILASSNAGEVVLDPFAGSGTTLVCAEQLGRRWLGCELDRGYCNWAIARIEEVPERTVDEWIDLDREVARRRESIR